MRDLAGMRGAVLIGGTGSDVGKSVTVAGLCRWLARNGVKVAPFKAQNMSLNSAVTPGGGEIGRAQAAQAFAAGVTPTTSMNPILIKPTADTHAQVIVMGRVECETDADEYERVKPTLFPRVLEALRELRDTFDVVVCEGAGSIAEFNLRERDIVNLGLARAANIPVVLVGDIDKGGVFASFLGSLELLDGPDRDLVRAFWINKFRGDLSILRPGLEAFARRTSRPVVAVVPWLHGVWVDAEDALSTQSVRTPPEAPLEGDVIDVAVVAYRRMSNFTDLDPLAAEPGVRVRFTVAPADLVRADLCILPGSKQTIADLDQVREWGVGYAVEERARLGLPTIGICAGYQMLGEWIHDDIESRAGRVRGLGLLPVRTTFRPTKVLANRTGLSPPFGAAEVRGYQIHNGAVTSDASEPLITSSDGDDGVITGSVIGTSWHGIFESDEFRSAILGWVASERGLAWKPSGISFEELRSRAVDRVADAIEASLDADAFAAIVESSVIS